MLTRWISMSALTALLLAPAGVWADQIELTGVLRDFKRGDKSGGHLDFETAHLSGRGGYGLAPGLVGPVLSDEGLPVYASPRPSRDTIYSSNTLNQWYRDVANVNARFTHSIRLDNGQGTQSGGVYSYSNSAFFPLDGRGFGNQSLSHNYHFTFELRTRFTYQPGQSFTFIGDDDVWVYVNGVKVIDLGGVHQAVTGKVMLFNGKAFLDAASFRAGGIVQTVSTDLAAQLRANWANLRLSGTCPIAAGALYIDLNLDEDLPEIRCQFATTAVTIYSVANLANVIIQFKDGTQQQFSNLDVGTGATFSGTGAYAGKEIIGCWVRAGQQPPDGSLTGNSLGQYRTPAGGGATASLDFFFAERHTTESNFRIDTSMLLKPVVPTSMSPMYD